MKTEPPARTILYYPEIQIPTSGTWIRKSLLYWDKLGAIVPKTYDGQMDAKRLKRYSPEIERLYKDGIFKPFNPEVLFHNSKTSLQLQREFQDTLFPGADFDHPTEVKSGKRCDVPIYRDKVARNVFAELEANGLAIKSDDHSLYLFERETANLYMALLAKHLAATAPDPTVPASDSDEEIGAMFGKTKTRDPENMILSAKFEDIIPIPSTDTPLPKILRFREKHQDALRSFRAAVDGFEQDLKKCEDSDSIRKAIQSQRERIESETNALSSQLKANTITAFLGSIEAFIKPSSPAILGAGYAAATKATSIASVPVEVLAAGAAGAGLIGVGLHWFNKVQERKALKRSSFAYLLLAKRKLG